MNLYSKALSILVLVVLSTCGKGTKTDSSIKLSFDGATLVNKQLLALATPTWAATYTCLGIMVAWENSTNICTTSNNQTFKPSYVSPTTFATADGAEFQLPPLPSGPNRTVYIIGFPVPSSESCEPLNVLDSKLDFDSTPPVILGQASFDFAPGEQLIELNASATGAPSIDECNGPLFDWNDEPFTALCNNNPSASGHLDIKFPQDPSVAASDSSFILCHAAQVSSLAASGSTIELGYNYILGKDINMGGATWTDGIGSPNTPAHFTGIFDGKNKKIYDLNITYNGTPNTEGSVGFFDSINGQLVSGQIRGKVENLRLDKITVSGSLTTLNHMGVVAGQLSGPNAVEGGIMRNVHVLNSTVSYDGGSTPGGNSVGGLTGIASAGSRIIYSSFESGGVGCGGANYCDEMGGLVGVLDGSLILSWNKSPVTARNSPTATNAVGGLVGEMGHSGVIAESYSNGLVVLGTNVSGLVGNVPGGGAGPLKICHSYSAHTSDISGNITNYTIGNVTTWPTNRSFTNNYFHYPSHGGASGTVETISSENISIGRDLTLQASFAGFNFSTFWNGPQAAVNNGFPTLDKDYFLNLTGVINHCGI